MLRASSLAALFTAFALGFAASSYTHLAAAPDTSGEEAKRKLQALADVDLEEYSRLKTEEERFKKAEEILSKMMGIFMADLGLRISPQAASRAKEPFSSKADARAPEPFAPKLPPLQITAKPQEAAPAPEKNWKAAENNLLNAREEGEVIANLRKTRIEDLEKELKTSGSFSNRHEMLGNLLGHFNGNSHITMDGKLKTWEIDFTLTGAMNDNSLEGNLRLTLAEHGKIFSDTKNSGTISSFRELAGETQGLLLRAEENTYLQIYYLKDTDQLAANLYKRKSEAANFEYIGSASLRRF